MNSSTKIRMKAYSGLTATQRRSVRKAVISFYRESGWAKPAWVKAINTQAKKYGVTKNVILAVMNE